MRIGRPATGEKRRDASGTAAAPPERRLRLGFANSGGTSSGFSTLPYLGFGLGYAF